MGRVKDNALFISEMQLLSEKEIRKQKRKVAKDSLETLKKERPHLRFTPEREEEYINSFIEFRDFWRN